MGPVWLWTLNHGPFMPHLPPWAPGQGRSCYCVYSGVSTSYGSPEARPSQMFTSPMPVTSDGNMGQGYGDRPLTKGTT